MLSGKFRRPIFTGGYIIRARLIEKLDAFLKLPLTIVKAPAGYGKTTLVNAWAETSIDPVTWLSLDDNDNDLQAFVRYLVYALRTSFPGALPQTFTLASSLISPPFDRLITCLLGELDELNYKSVLVLDNFERIRDGQICELIATLLSYPLPQLHLLITTRDDTTLPTSSLRARHLLGEITARDLLFTQNEARDLFLDTISSGKLDESKFEYIVRQMEGWATGLSLYAASIASEEAGSVAAFESASRYIKDYFTSEVLYRITSPLRELLCQVSIVDKLCDGLCDALFQDPARTVQSNGGASFLRRLERENLFISSSSSEPGWYDLHPAFRAVLHAHLEENYARDEIERLHVTATYWYARQGRFKDALNHAQMINVKTALDIYRTYRLNILASSTGQEMEEWLSLFPANFIRSLPELLLSQAWLMLINIRLPEMENLLDRLESLINDPENESEVEQKAELNVLRAMHYARMGNASQALDCLQTIDNVQPAGDFLRSSLVAARCNVLRLMGDIDSWIELLRENIEVATTTRSYHVSLRLLPSMCTLKLITAHLGDAERTAHFMLEVSQERNIKAYIGIARLYLGVAAYHKNMLDQARGYFSDALGQAEFMDPENIITCYLGLAATERALGNHGRTRVAIDKAKSFLTSILSLDLLPYVEIFDAELMLRQGMKLQNVSVLREWKLLWTDILQHPTQTISRQLAQKGPEGCSKALSILERLGEDARSKGNELLYIGVIAQTALLLEAVERHEEANKCLKKALDLAELTGCLRIFLDLGMPMFRLLQRNGIQKTEMYVEIMDAFDHEAPFITDSVTKMIMEHLTEKELNVLGYLRQRFSNKEIADHLYISPATVKTHTIHIYQKLGVNGRREAVEKAKNLGIFVS